MQKPPSHAIFLGESKSLSAVDRKRGRQKKKTKQQHCREVTPDSLKQEERSVVLLLEG